MGVSRAIIVNRVSMVTYVSTLSLAFESTPHGIPAGRTKATRNIVPKRDDTQRLRLLIAGSALSGAKIALRSHSFSDLLTKNGFGRFTNNLIETLSPVDGSLVKPPRPMTVCHLDIEQHGAEIRQCLRFRPTSSISFAQSD